MKLSIRWQLALVSVALARLPIVLVGTLAYRIARARSRSVSASNLQTLACRATRSSSGFSSTLQNGGCGRS